MAGRLVRSFQWKIPAGRKYKEGEGVEEARIQALTVRPCEVQNIDRLVGLHSLGHAFNHSGGTSLNNTLGGHAGCGGKHGLNRLESAGALLQRQGGEDGGMAIYVKGAVIVAFDEAAFLHVNGPKSLAV